LRRESRGLSLSGVLERERENQQMAAFLLDAFVFVEMLVIAASLVWASRTARSQALQALLPMIAVLLVIATLIALPRVKGDGDGLYVIGLIPFSLIILLPAAALAFAGAAWFSSRQKLRDLQRQGQLDDDRG
jgi:hypothetical protein